MSYHRIYDTAYGPSYVDWANYLATPLIWTILSLRHAVHAVKTLLPCLYYKLNKRISNSVLWNIYICEGAIRHGVRSEKLGYELWSRKMHAKLQNWVNPEYLDTPGNSSGAAWRWRSLGYTRGTRPRRVRGGLTQGSDFCVSKTIKTDSRNGRNKRLTLAHINKRTNAGLKKTVLKGYYAFTASGTVSYTI
jgi:hypothetical protein